MFQTIRHFLHATADTHAARRQYFDLVSESESILSDLRLTVSPDRRARQLGLLALCETGMSQLHRTAFGSDGTYDAGIAETAQMHEALMEVEHAIAHHHARRPATDHIERDGGRLLDEIVRVGGLTNSLRDDLFHALSFTLHPAALKELDMIPFPGSNRFTPS